MQFPILVSYYLTISRAQGQTFQKAGMYLPKNVFAHGHMYVGLSRCGDPKGLHIFADQGEFAHVANVLDATKSYSKNVVYTKMLEPRVEPTNIPPASIPSPINAPTDMPITSVDSDDRSWVS